MSYSVVDFEDGVSTVPTCWLTENNSLCFWPSHIKSAEGLRRAIQACKKPTETWASHNIVSILGKATDDFKQAERRVVRAKTKTDVETTSADEASCNTRKLRGKRNMTYKEISTADEDAGRMGTVQDNLPKVPEEMLKKTPDPDIVNGQLPNTDPGKGSRSRSSTPGPRSQGPDSPITIHGSPTTDNSTTGDDNNFNSMEIKTSSSRDSAFKSSSPDLPEVSQGLQRSRPDQITSSGACRNTGSTRLSQDVRDQSNHSIGDRSFKPDERDRRARSRTRSTSRNLACTSNVWNLSASRKSRSKSTSRRSRSRYSTTSRSSGDQLEYPRNEGKSYLVNQNESSGRRNRSRHSSRDRYSFERDRSIDRDRRMRRSRSRSDGSKSSNVGSLRRGHITRSRSRRRQLQSKICGPSQHNDTPHRPSKRDSLRNSTKSVSAKNIVSRPTGRDHHKRPSPSQLSGFQDSSKRRSRTRSVDGNRPELMGNESRTQQPANSNGKQASKRAQTPPAVYDDVLFRKVVLSYMREIKKNSDLLVASRCSDIVLDEDQSDISGMFPVCVEEDLEELEKRLENKDFKSRVAVFFARFGGNNVQDAINTLCRKAMSDELAISYSFMGGKGNKDFSALKLCSTMLLGVRSNKTTAKATEDDMKSVVSKFLNRAKDRLTQKKATAEKKKNAANVGTP